MLFSDTYLVTQNLSPALLEDVAHAEARLETSFPAGYAEYVTTLGKGEYCGFVNLFLPDSIVGDLSSHRAMLAEYPDFWQEGLSILSQEQRLQSISIGNTIDGDVLVFLPRTPNRIYLLPRHSDSIFLMGEGLPQALDWLFGAGVYLAQRSTDFSYFESSRDRSYLRFWNRKSLRQRISTLTYDVLKDWLLRLGEHDHLLSHLDRKETEPQLIGLELQDEIRIVDANQARYFQAFYKEFGGYVRCHEGLGEGDLSIDIHHDAGSQNPTLRSILDKIQAAGFNLLEQGTYSC